MKTKLQILITTLFSLFLVTSCVSLSVYENTERQVNTLETERVKLESEISKLNVEIKSLQDSIIKSDAIVESVKRKSNNSRNK